MDELTKQVEMLAETIKIMISRQEQLFKMQEEKSVLLSETAQSLKKTMDDLEITNAALIRSLDEVDQQVDDLAKITAALLQLQQALQQAAS